MIDRLITGLLLRAQDEVVLEEADSSSSSSEKTTNNSNNNKKKRRKMFLDGFQQAVHTKVGLPLSSIG